LGQRVLIGRDHRRNPLTGLFQRVVRRCGHGALFEPSLCEKQGLVDGLSNDACHDGWTQESGRGQASRTAEQVLRPPLFVARLLPARLALPVSGRRVRDRSARVECDKKSGGSAPAKPHSLQLPLSCYLQVFPPIGLLQFAERHSLSNIRDLPFCLGRQAGELESLSCN